MVLLSNLVGMVYFVCRNILDIGCDLDFIQVLFLYFCCQYCGGVIYYYDYSWFQKVFIVIL